MIVQIYIDEDIMPFIINYTYCVEQTFILIQNVPLYVCYMFRPVLRPSSGMSIQASHKNV